MSFPSDFSPKTCPQRPLQTVLIGTSLEDESDQVVRAGLISALRSLVTQGDSVGT